MSRSVTIADETVIDKIYRIRGKKVMLDRDLAEMYGVEIRALNQAVKRNENPDGSSVTTVTEGEFVVRYSED